MSMMNPCNLIIIIALWILSCTAPVKQDDPLLNPAHETWTKHAPKESLIRIETSKGFFVVALHRAWSPLGVDRFYNLVRLGYFDNSRFYRVRENFITQFGIAGNPKVAQAWENETIADDPVNKSNLRGFISFAMTAPNTRTTQLFINLKDNDQLDGQGFSPLGFVIEGMEVVDAIYNGYDETSGGGMRGGKQQKLFELGNAYLDKEFPNLDKLIKAEIIDN